MAGLVPATHRLRLLQIGPALFGRTLERMGHRDKPGGDDHYYPKNRVSTFRVIRVTNGSPAARPCTHSVVPALNTSPAPLANDAMIAWPRNTRACASGEF